MKWLILILMTMSLNIHAQAAKTCEACQQIEKLTQKYDNGEEKKAYEAFNSLVSDIDLSKDKNQRREELVAIVKATSAFLKSDERLDLPQYLQSMREVYPEDVNYALEKLPKDEKKNLEEYINAAEELKKKGEEP